MSWPARLLAALRRTLRDERGASAVEFAMLAPIFGLIFAAAADFGGIVSTKLTLENTVSAAANYALVNAASVTSGSASSLASSVATIASNGWADATVTVNAGPTRTKSPSGTGSSGSSTPADSCYCPSKGSSGVIWGGSVTCGSSCSGGGLAGKFVAIAAQHAYTPLFIGYGLVQQGQVRVRAVVQTQ